MSYLIQNCCIGYSPGINIETIFYSRFHNDKQISSTSVRHKVSMDLDAKLYYLCRLEISKVDAADAGTYKAVATNEFGEGFATINLTFEEGKEIGLT